MSSARAARILTRVREIPEGFVRTYGDIDPGAPRLVGRVLADCAAAGCIVEELEVGRADLEDVFMQLISDKPAQRIATGAAA
mgnify:CR=1 FL=1